MKKPKKKPINRFWSIDEETIFLNHGSFGSTPKIVLEEQNRWRMMVEKDPVKFYEEVAPKALLDARIAIANFVKCSIVLSLINLLIVLPLLVIFKIVGTPSTY